MKRIIIAIVLLIGILSISNIKVNAQVFNSRHIFENNEENKETDSGFITENGKVNSASGDANVSCDGLLTQDGLDMIKEILGWIRILAPIVLVLFVALDLSSAVMSNDNDALSKATKKIIPRLIGVALLFFVPTIIRAILSIDGVAESITIPDDPLCKTMKEEKIDLNKYELVI